MEHLLRATAEAETRHFWFRGLRAFVAPLIRQAVDGVNGARILDCGCGTGANLDLLNRYGRACGLELSAIGLDIARGAGRARLTRGTVAALPFATGAFDVVTAFDVLYSLDAADEQAAVAEMFRVIKRGGFAVVNVAAMEILRGDHSVLSREVRRYSRQSLRVLLERAGFTIVRLTYTNAALFVPLAIARALQRRRGLAAEADATREIAVPPAPINALLTAVVRAEAAWLARADSPFGSSLLCLARKPA